CAAVINHTTGTWHKISEQGPGQKRLYSDLMKNYSNLERPFGLNLMQIMDVDEKNQVLTTNIWLQVTWNAYNLRWDPEEYPGVRNVRFPNNLLWKPDLLLYNSADERFDATFHTNIVVDHSGECTYIPPAIFKSTCKIDVRWFPFDEQRCELKFGSWSYDGWAIDLKMKDADLSGYTPNGEWDLVEVPGVKTDKLYPCCPEPYPDITYTVVMRRRTLYYGLNLLIPCILISTLALLVFLLPADSGEKISLGITVLLSLTVFMLLVAEIMPATSDTVPLILLATTMVIVGCLSSPPSWSYSITIMTPTGTRVFLLNWCAWFLRMKRPGEDKVRPACPNKGLRSSLSSMDVLPNGTAGHLTNTSNMLYVSVRGWTATPLHAERHLPGLWSHEELLMPGTHGYSAGGVEPDLGKILDEVRYIATRFRDQDQEEMVCNEWKFAACVIDRLCLMAFSLFTILCTIGILMSAPNFVEAISKDVFSN
uniref:Cholinergic receptor, nicotinic, alpha 7 (neuronal) n=1 Tax=Neogobius melanostomus TaxID=47308 RepID=A0A8C6U9B2_9GOBI